MSYFVRYFISSKPPEINTLQKAISLVDANVRLHVDPQKTSSAEVTYGLNVCGELEINVPGDGLFEDEIEELIECAQEGKGNFLEVVDALKDCKGIIVEQILYSGRDFREVLDEIDPIWLALDDTMPGLLHFDAHGFYLQGELVLDLEN